MVQIVERESWVAKVLKTATFGNGGARRAPESVPALVLLMLTMRHYERSHQDG